MDETTAKRIFQEDIQSLLDLTFTDGPVKERHLRLASVILRRWLCDNDLRFLPGSARAITLPALDDAHILRFAAQDPETDYYISVGVKFDGRPIMFLYHSNADDPPAWLQDFKRPVFERVRPSAALQKTVLYFREETFSLGEVLRFACNKLGGAHLDARRDSRQTLLDDAAAYLTYGPPVDTLPDARVGEIHVPLESSGTEIISAIGVVVIAASAMLVQIHFADQPFVRLDGQAGVGDGLTARFAW